MAKAFILVETAVGKSKEVLDVMMNMGGVVSVNAVTGPYDIIAIVESDSLNDIRDLVTTKIHPIAGVARTVTCLALQAN